MWWTHLASALVGVAVLNLPATVSASNAIWMTPSNQWLGVDGNWSLFEFAIGSPGQFVNLLPSTALSEFWIVEPTGCDPQIQICFNARGGVWSPRSSSTWSPLPGPYELGNLAANGDYGFETLDFQDSTTTIVYSANNVFVAGFNTTLSYQGVFGLGGTHTNISNRIAIPYISQLAEVYGYIPSHSYGYSAGAYYGPNYGTPASVTLGGYDSLRFVDNNVVFQLKADVNIPEVRIRGISVTAKSPDKQPTVWNASTQTLAYFDDFNQPGLQNIDYKNALIDTTLPYMWLPQNVCDRFAAVLNLTWSDEFGVYLFRNPDQYNRWVQDPSALSFTFTLSSYDNQDDLGRPLNVPGVVNITIAGAAFAQLLRYPYPSMKFSDSSIPYFPLKRLDNGARPILGRAFMQEAYIIVSYDRSEFTLHQAILPSDPSKTAITSMERPPDSPLPGYNDPNPPGSHSLTTGQMVGIICAAVVVGIILLISSCCWYRRHKRRTARSKKTPETVEEEFKDSESGETPEQPRSPVRRMISMIIRKKRSRKPVANEAQEDGAQPAEVANHEVYEMPVPIAPVELDSNNDIADEITDLGTESSQGMSAYELARRKLERQLQGPVPTYAASYPDGHTAPVLPLNEKSAQDASLVAHYHAQDVPLPSPASSPSPTYGTNSDGSLPNTLPSPVTPYPDHARFFDLPSPMTVAPPFPSPHAISNDAESGSVHMPYSPESYHFPRPHDQVSVSRSNSSNNSPVSPVGSVVPPSPAYQRTPIDPSRVICLGPLPENVQLPRHYPSVPQLARQQSSRNPLPRHHSSSVMRQPQRESSLAQLTRRHANLPIVPRLITPDGRTIAPAPESIGLPQSPESGSGSPAGHEQRQSASTLGSNFTVEEEILIQEEMTRQISVRNDPATEPSSEGTATENTPRSPLERIDPSELVHVPQVADRRYSWEEPERDISRDTKR